MTARWVPDSGRAQQGRVGLALDEGQSGEVLDLERVEFELEGEVVVVQRLVVRQPRQPQALAEAPVVADTEFFAEDEVEEIEFALLSPLGVLVQALGEVGQAELGGRGADAIAGQLAQRASFGVELVVNGRVPVSSS